MVATGTGRLSARCPNVQQVPKGVTKLRADVSPQEVETCVRAAFVPPPGYVLMSADYTQLEMRLMAAFSRDAKLGEVRQPGLSLSSVPPTRILDSTLLL